jgi:hypothetical protein
MCPARTRTLRLRRNRITRVFGVCYPRTYNDVTNGWGTPNSLFFRASELRALQRAH